MRYESIPMHFDGLTLYQCSKSILIKRDITVSWAKACNVDYPNISKASIYVRTDRKGTTYLRQEISVCMNKFLDMFKHQFKNCSKIQCIKKKKKIDLLRGLRDEIFLRLLQDKASKSIPYLMNNLLYIIITIIYDLI